MPHKFGQHFLIKDEILERLAVAACGQCAPRVIEIGPGRGALTRHLLPFTQELHAVEIDVQLVRQLEEKFSAETKLHVHAGDILATDLAQWGPAVLAGNLPYYITSPIIDRFLKLNAHFPTAVFLMQWEVAERLLARPGTREFGYLTVSTQLLCDVDLICKVPPSAFHPPPKVDSGAVRLRRKTGIVADIDRLLPFVSRCFLRKRKTLRNNLRAEYGARIDDLPEASLRAEQLSVSQFVDLYRRLH